MEQPIKKKEFLSLPDLAFGFVHKRSGNEIMLRPYVIKNKRRFLLNRTKKLHEEK